MIVIILSPLSGDATVVDGVDRTMMIAAETTRTAAIIFPSGGAVEHDVADGTHLGTQSAVQAHVGVDGELLVGNHVAVEVSPNDVTERPRRQSQGQTAVACLPFLDHLNKYIQVFAGLLLFLTFPLRCVGIHEGQADVALRHRERLATVHRDALFRQLLRQHLDGQPRAVAAGAQNVRIVPAGIADSETADELAHDVGRLPAVNGEAEAYPLVVGKGIFTRRFQLFRNEEQPLSSGLGQLLSRPPRIACTRKIEYHGAKLRKNS